MSGVDQSATRRHWDAMASSYDGAKARNAAYYRVLKALVCDAVPADKRGRVLEAGCGTGQVLAALAPRAGIGVDLSPAMIDEARRRWAGRPELEFRFADAASGGLGELGVFDAVVCADVLEHVAHWRAVVDALVAACRDGGLVVVTTPNPRWALPLWVLEKLRLKMPEGPHRYVGASDIAEYLQRKGLDVGSRSTHLLVPAHLGGLGPALSRVAARLPLLRDLGVIQLVVATRSPR